MLAQPGLGEWPPLRIAKNTWNCQIIRRRIDRTWAELGWTTHDGVFQHVSDLHEQAKAA